MNTFVRCLNSLFSSVGKSWNQRYKGAKQRYRQATSVRLPNVRPSLALELLEARDMPSTFVPGTYEPAAANVQYQSGPGALYSPTTHVSYALTPNGTLQNLSTQGVLATNVQTFALSSSPSGDTVVAQSGTSLGWAAGNAQNASSTFKPFLWVDGNVENFQVGSDGTVDELHYGGFFAHWAGPAGYGAGYSPTIELGGVSKYEVAPNNTLYTLQYTSGPTPQSPFYSGNVDAWVGSSLIHVQGGINTFGVDSYSNIVTVAPSGTVYSDYTPVGSDPLLGLFSGYDQRELIQNSAGNLGW